MTIPRPLHAALIALAMVFLFAIVAGTARAHDWYTDTANENGYKCCGGNDCRPLRDGDVSEVGGGYYIASEALFVPYGRAQASPDGAYHVCIVPSVNAIDNAPRCFFAPIPGY